MDGMGYRDPPLPRGAPARERGEGRTGEVPVLHPHGRRRAGRAAPGHPPMDLSLRVQAWDQTDAGPGSDQCGQERGGRRVPHPADLLGTRVRLQGSGRPRPGPPHPQGALPPGGLGLRLGQPANPPPRRAEGARHSPEL
eukprot:13279569-Heterocapsa_arctica.AAC.1